MDAGSRWPCPGGAYPWRVSVACSAPAEQSARLASDVFQRALRCVSCATGDTATRDGVHVGAPSRAQRESHGRPLRPWLIRIAHNLAANLYRDRSRKPASPIDDTTALAATHTTEQLVEGREQARAVLDGVSRLPGDRREALIMRFALGMDNREIARALGRSDGATKVLIHRAIKQLEGLVADADVDGSSVDGSSGGDAGESSGGGAAGHASGHSGTPPEKEGRDDE